ncbi:RtcB family protein [Mesorhizobium sp. M1423]|uniref:RtcB family protein n=1 Tax=Mesorhizobium sp. M1423 TaxID=2957101 RepID=UPI0033379CD3
MAKPIHINLQAGTDHEFDNYAKVIDHVTELSKVETVEALAVLPDACPAGQAPGTIPVGGVAKVRGAIHPGMHSADVCCSMAYTNLGKVDPAIVLTWAMATTHFGMGGRAPDRVVKPPFDLIAKMENNPFFRDMGDEAVTYFATQGDGNHFLYVGTLASTGDTVIVTHHGSRKPGAILYKAGMRTAHRYSKDLKHNAYIPFDTLDGMHYWAALQLIRRWTKASHFAIHDIVAELVQSRPIDRFWNEHNFVFWRGDHFYHAKGATPNYAGFSPDDDGRTLIPMNCTEPILIAGHVDNPNSLGFAPHGAGRNFSRKQHFANIAGRDPAEVFAEETKGLDVRAFNGKVDLSELPSAYKNAPEVRRQIAHYGLATITDTIQPYGSIMAGEAYQPWLKKRKGVSGTRADTIIVDEVGA